MKKIIFCLITICVALFAAACTPEDEAPVSSGGAEVSAPDASGTASEETLPPADESSSPWDKWNTDESLLTDAQRQQLEALREDGERHAGTFWYQEMMIFGRVDPAQPKLDLETAKKICAENTDFETILEEFDKIQPYPDYIGGSGITYYLYWISESTKPHITILYEQKQIYGKTYNEDGTLLASETLFDHRYLG